MMIAQTLHVVWNPLWLVIGLFFAVVIMRAASKSRQQLAETDLKLCKSCGTSHPNFARFCRQCGKNLVE